MDNVVMDCCTISKNSTPVLDRTIDGILQCSQTANSISIVIFHERMNAERSGRAEGMRNCVVESCVCVWGAVGGLVSICAVLMPFNDAAEESEHQSQAIYGINHAFNPPPHHLPQSAKCTCKYKHTKNKVSQMTA